MQSGRIASCERPIQSHHRNRAGGSLYRLIPDPHTPMGLRGIGEIGITGTGAAVANAIYNACGKRIRELPITLDKLL
jgi:hypothetical protein